jgi:hypothetical protein
LIPQTSLFIAGKDPDRIIKSGKQLLGILRGAKSMGSHEHGIRGSGIPGYPHELLHRLRGARGGAREDSTFWGQALPEPRHPKMLENGLEMWG